MVVLLLDAEKHLAKELEVREVGIRRVGAGGGDGEDERLGARAGACLQDLVDLFSVFPVNADAHFQADAESLEEHHGLAHTGHGGKGLGDLPGFSETDSLDLGEALRLLLHDAQGVVPEVLHDAGGQGLADSFHGAGAQVDLNGLCRLGGPEGIILHLELPAVGVVIRIAALRLDPDSFLNMRKEADACQLLLLLCDRKDRVSVLIIPVDNMLDDAADLLFHISSVSAGFYTA